MGNTKMTVVVFSTLWASSTLGCGDQAPTRDHGKQTEPVVRIAADQRWAKVERPSETFMLDAPAWARAAASTRGDVQVLLRAKVEKVHVHHGASVRKGEPIVDVTAPEVASAAAKYIGAKERLTLHQQRVNQLEVALAEQLIRSDEVFAQRALVAELKEQQDHAAATLRSVGVPLRIASRVTKRGYITLRAPVDGVVTELVAHPGAILEPASVPVARIVGQARGHIEVKTQMPWPKAARVVFVASDGRTLELEPEPAAAITEPGDGSRVTWYAPRDPQARFGDGLKGVARMVPAGDVWRVPVTALVKQRGKTYLFARRGNQRRRREVTVWTTDARHAFVGGKFQADDEVAEDGQDMLAREAPQ